MGFITVAGKNIETDLVIFDKDGTLLDFNKTWVDIIRLLIVELEKNAAPANSLKKNIERLIGIDIDAKKVNGNGSLAMGTAHEVNVLLAGALFLEGIVWNKALDIVDKTTRNIFEGEIREKSLVASNGALTLLKALKKSGIVTAVATNDTAKDASADMKVIGALEYLDYIIGCDTVEKAKPFPDMIELLYKKTGIKQKKTVMIGDTLNDVIMGKNAGVGLNIGIEDLVPGAVLGEYADIIIKSLEEIK